MHPNHDPAVELLFEKCHTCAAQRWERRRDDGGDAVQLGKKWQTDL
jgi:hypothetical protein